MSGKKTKTPRPARGPKHPATPPLPLDSSGFWDSKAPTEVTAGEEGQSVMKIEDLAAPPGSLWRDDQEFDQFLGWLRATRQERG